MGPRGPSPECCGWKWWGPPEIAEDAAPNGGIGGCLRCSMQDKNVLIGWFLFLNETLGNPIEQSRVVTSYNCIVRPVSDLLTHT